jgi:hypothetical protein
MPARTLVLGAGRVSAAAGAVLEGKIRRILDVIES